MTPSRWRTLKEIAADAMEFPPHERAAYILRACGEDSALKEEVERLVAASDPDATGPLDRPFAAGPPEKPSLPANMLLAGRFRITGLLAKGGMGEVYRARDERMREDVALKIIGREIADRPGIVDRFRHEVQRARRITHPNVCRIHDLYIHSAPDGANLQFLTMQLIAGPTLAEWIARPEKNPVSESLPLLMDLLAGLQAAHDAGIAHCDLKPSNVLLDRPEGQRARAVITDFGLARALRDEIGPETTRTNIVGGAPAYMPPEMRFGSGGGVTGDIYAFGLIAYELLTGVHPFDYKPVWEAGPGHPLRPPRSLVPEIPAVWDAVILRCLELEPAARFGSVTELLSAVGSETEPLKADSAPAENVPGPSGGLRRPWWRVLLAVGAALIIAAVGWQTAPRWLHPRALSGGAAGIPARRVLVADIDNQTGQTLLDHTVRELVTAMLEQSPVVKVFPPAQLPEALRRMGKPENSDLGIPIALEICQREGLEAMVTGSVTRIGSEYLIILKALDSQGETITSASASASSLDQVIRAAEEASRTLRTSLGEPTASIRQSKPLERVTSPSLQAVQYYSLGKISLNRGDPESAADLFQRAIQTDPRFAMAHGYLGNVYEQLGEMAAAQKELSIAVQLSDRVTEPEKLKIAGDYYLSLDDYAEAARFYQLLIRIRPEMASAHLNLGEAYFHQLNFDRALAETDAAVQIDPQTGYKINAVEILLGAGRCGEAMARARKLVELSPATSRLNYIMGRCYLAAGEVERANSLFERNCVSPGQYQAWGCVALADVALASHRFERVRADLERALAVGQKNRNESEVVWASLAIENFDVSQKRRLAGDTINVAKIEHDDQLFTLAIELCGTTGDAGKLREMIAALERQRIAHETQRTQFLSAVAQSTLARIESERKAAVDWAKTAVKYDSSVFAIDQLAQAYVAAGNNAEAARQFESVILRSGERMESYDQPAYHRLREVHEELAMLYEGLGDHARAQAHLTAVAAFTN
jgi:serine/threonine protein kinase/tetratricopeptide (TPR) repeat protein